MFFKKLFGDKRQGASALMLGVFLSLQALVTFPALHTLVHPDAGDSDHECGVTLFAHGQVNASATTVGVVRAPAQIVFTEAKPAEIFASTDVPLLPGRGPPAGPSVS
jgi:hypothetical protein